MIVKYDEYQGKLLNYEVIDNEKVYIKIEVGKNATVEVYCNEYEVKIPNIMGNYKNLDK